MGWTREERSASSEARAIGGDGSPGAGEWQVDRRGFRSASAPGEGSTFFFTLPAA
jgi:hypothetical protein